jgi:inner membrane protein YidH
MSTERVPNDRRAAEYLANERTFLAWIRTAISLLGLGFALAKLSLWIRDLAGYVGWPFPARTGTAFPMGELLMALGGAIAVLAAWHYHAVNRAIEEDRVEPDRGLIVLITAAVLLIALTMGVALRFVR